MTITETYCTECETTTRDETPHCPSCGAEDPWDTRPAYQFDENDLPIVFSIGVYKDNWELWAAFCDEYWDVYELKGSDVSGLPDDFPRLKYCTTDLFYAVTEDYELNGPFLSKADARESFSNTEGDGR